MDIEHELKIHKAKIANTIKRDFSNISMDIDDLIQEGLIGFYDALKKMDKSTKTNVFSYCYQMAKWRCLDYLRKHKKDHRDVPIDFISDFSSHELQENDTCEKISEINLLEKAFEHCHGHHRRVLLLELYGVKTNNDDKILSNNSIRRIKREYKNVYLGLTGS